MRARLLVHRDPAPLDAATIAARAHQAAEARAPLASSKTDGYRLIHGPGDGLEGLVADRYGDIVALRVYSSAWLPWLPAVVEGLRASVPATQVVVRLPKACEADPACWLRDGAIIDGPDQLESGVFYENGLRFEVDPVRGQKTGFFLDQRENRERVERLAAGRDAANLFAYTGGFSLYAARGGATSVVSVDASGPAVDACVRNFALNADHPAVARCRHEAVRSDAFDWLSAQEPAKYGLIVVDPPAFAKRASEVEGALAAYRRLARLAAPLLAPGGHLVSASCSSRVGPEAFFAAVAEGVAQSGRAEEVLETTGHPVDHPISVSSAQYLKCRYSRLR